MFFFSVGATPPCGRIRGVSVVTYNCKQICCKWEENYAIVPAIPGFLDMASSLLLQTKASYISHTVPSFPSLTRCGKAVALNL